MRADGSFMQFFILTIIFLLLSENSCIAKNVQPHYYFVVGIRGNYTVPDDVYQAKFDKKEDAYVAYQRGAESFSGVYGIYSSLIAPPPGDTTINGLPFAYDWNFQLVLNSFAYPPNEQGAIFRYAECPVGYVARSIYSEINIIYSCEDQKSTLEPDCDICNSKNPAPALGKPILPSSGIERELENDYQGQGSNKLFFNRNYRSDRNGWNNNYQIFGMNFNAPAIENPGAIACYPSIGSTTGHSYCFPYAGSGQVNDFGVFRGNDRILNFGTSTDLLPTSDINDRVLAQVDVDGNPVGYKVYKSQDDSTEWYDNGGHVTAIVDRNGQSKSYLYSDATTPTSIAPQSGLLVRISDNFGHQINLAYDSNSRMVLMVDSVGNSYSYAYNEPTSIVLPGNVSVDNLTSVTYPDGKKRIYWYNEQNKTAGVNLPYAMTGITDENGIRYATIQYDATGKAASTELAGGAQKYTVSYPSLYQQSSVIDPLGTTRTYSFQAILGLVRSTGLSQPGPSGGTVSTSIIYDNQGNVASATDFNGVKTTYAYDLTRNLETSRVEAAGTPQARTTITTWHATYRLPLQIAEPKRITTFAYDTSGNLLSKAVQATTDNNGSQGFGAAPIGKARVWSYTYNSFGQVLTATGPRTDVNDTTSYVYDGSGNLTTVTNAAGHVTSLSNYDANGRAGTITAPNGDITNLTYTARGWLSSKTVVANGVSQTTTYDHDGVGQLIKVTLPDGSYVAYTYDDAHRLTDISDGLGNSIAYTLDLQGNRISEASKDATGALARQVSRVYDSLNNLQQQTGGVQ